MVKIILLGSAAIYWICFLLRIYLWTKEKNPWEKITAYLEKAALLFFTTGLVLYINKLEVVNGQLRFEHYDMPISFLLFAWSISVANLVMETVYNNRWTAIFSNLWTGLSLTLSPASTPSFGRLFTYDLEWLSFHRLCFLLGYAFCVLAFPLVLFFCFSQWRLRSYSGAERDKLKRHLNALDRMAYRAILWALPLLTAGIITETLLLLEANQFPGPLEIWIEKRETLLALAAWFLCGIYLHSRLFFGWRHMKAAGLYLSGLTLLLGGHVAFTVSRHF